MDRPSLHRHPTGGPPRRRRFSLRGAGGVGRCHGSEFSGPNPPRPHLDCFPFDEALATLSATRKGGNVNFRVPMPRKAQDSGQLPESWPPELGAPQGSDRRSCGAWPLPPRHAAQKCDFRPEFPICFCREIGDPRSASWTRSDFARPPGGDLTGTTAMTVRRSSVKHFGSTQGERCPHVPVWWPSCGKSRQFHRTPPPSKATLKNNPRAPEIVTESSCALVRGKELRTNLERVFKFAGAGRSAPTASVFQSSADPNNFLHPNLQPEGRISLAAIRFA